MDYNNQVLTPNFKLSLKIFDGRKSLPHHKTEKWDQRDPIKILGVVYHQSLENFGTASGNSKYHVDPNHISDNGLPGLAYPLFVEKSGDIWLANNIEDITYSQGSVTGNKLYVGVCFGGNFSGPGYEGSQKPTNAQLRVARELWTHLKKIWGFKDNQLFGHYDFGKPACPGNELMEIIEDINSDYISDDNLNTTIGRQQALAELGYYTGKIDGDWGNKSKTALIAFQRIAGLKSDGVWGKQTNLAVLVNLGKSV
jgi:hypothetical protein